MVPQQRVTWPDWVLLGRTPWLEVRWGGREWGVRSPRGSSMGGYGGASVPVQGHEDALG